jgi:hypothetical protein
MTQKLGKKWGFAKVSSLSNPDEPEPYRKPKDG